MVAAIGLGALGALILGEYEMTAGVALAAGPLFGLAVAEVAVSVGGGRGAALAVVSAAATAVGLLWGAWISSSEGLRPFPATAWPAAAVGAGVAAWRAGRWRRPVTD